MYYCTLIKILIYLLIADLYLLGDPLNRQTFRGSFVVSSWKSEENEFNIGSWKNNRTRENEMQQKLTKIYQNSDLRSCFVSADILALDK